ncbi:hypothetical protein Q4Q35_02855 [Flavivirga aquimarina]|uniref:DUF4397 domain-containing protein n=1 Tax=Flavivirga aquimarina TaxID=2027862 RepID=A0ABT8W6J0_9FLAO|nr:hypothetical protein [Flavivirga aquimarina]MDO5968734.1 hypothetical protein [Flavivirga aquimarina]
MKPIFKFLAIFFSMGLFLSCSHEDDQDFPRAATIKVVNLIRDIDHVIVKIGDNPINYAGVSAGARVNFESFKNFSMEEGLNREVFIVAESDTLHSLYSNTLNLKGIHSLYFSGTSEAVETLLLEDTVKQFTDSIVGIRFLNLSKTSGPVDIMIAGEPSNIVSALEYESVTDYIEFPAKKADGSYTFEFKNAAGNSIANIIVDPLDANNRSTKKNLTLVISEFKLPIGNGLLFHKITRVNNY